MAAERSRYLVAFFLCLGTAMMALSKKAQFIATGARAAQIREMNRVCDLGKPQALTKTQTIARSPQIGVSCRNGLHQFYHETFPKDTDGWSHFSRGAGLGAAAAFSMALLTAMTHSKELMGAVGSAAVVGAVVVLNESRESDEEEQELPYVDVKRCNVTHAHANSEFKHSFTADSSVAIEDVENCAPACDLPSSLSTVEVGLSQTTQNVKILSPEEEELSREASRGAREQRKETVSTNAKIASAVGGTSGRIMGGATGALTGLLAAPFTFGLSIPAAAIFGAEFGSEMGTSVGGAAGAIVGHAQNEVQNAAQAVAIAAGEAFFDEVGRILDHELPGGEEELALEELEEAPASYLLEA